MDYVCQMLGSDADLLCIEFDLPVVSEVLLDSNEEFLGDLSVALRNLAFRLLVVKNVTYFIEEQLDVFGLFGTVDGIDAAKGRATDLEVGEAPLQMLQGNAEEVDKFTSDSEHFYKIRIWDTRYR